MQSTIVVEYEDEEEYDSIQVEVEYNIDGRDWPGTREEPPEYASLEIEGFRVRAFGREYLFDLEDVIEDYYEGPEDGVIRVAGGELESILWEDYKELAGDYAVDEYIDYMETRYEQDYY
jgi:hypothetical protein